VVAGELEKFLANLTPGKRQRDARTMLALMERVTGEPPTLSGTMIGFGSYHYHYESGREGDAAAASFAPRKAATVVYLMDGVEAHAEDLDRLGPHTTGVGCLYIKDLEQVDLAVLERIVAQSWRTLTRGTFTNRAREGGG
jgi:hypothetical protein